MGDAMPFLMWDKTMLRAERAENFCVCTVYTSLETFWGTNDAKIVHYFAFYICFGDHGWKAFLGPWHPRHASANRVSHSLQS